MVYFTKPPLDSRGIFNPRIIGWFSPTTQLHPPYAHNGPLLRSSQAQYIPNQTTMTYYNNVNHANFYSTPFTSGEFTTYPSMNGMLANEEANRHAPTNGWGVWTGFQAEASFSKDNCSLLLGQGVTRGSPGPTTSLTMSAAYTHGYGQPSSSRPEWPATDQAQPSSSNFVYWNIPFANTVTSEPSAAIPAPSSGKYLFANEISRT